MSTDPRTEAAHARRRELRERLRDATTAEERKSIAHEVGRVGASIRRWRNRAAKGDLSPPRVKLREAVRALEAFDARAARCVCGHGIILHAGIDGEGSCGHNDGHEYDCGCISFDRDGGPVETRAALVAALNAARAAVKEGTP